MSDASENVQPTAAVPPKKKAPLWLKVGAPVLAAVVAIGAFFGVRAIFDSLGGQSKQAQIEAAVEQAATRGVLDQDIAMRYTYVVESTGDTYDLEFTKEYC